MFGLQGGVSWGAVTPSDTTNFSREVRAVYVGVGGDIAIVAADGAVVTLKNVVAGSLLPIRPVRVNSTNTTATNLVVFY